MNLPRCLFQAVAFLHAAAASIVAAQRLESPALDPHTDISASGAYSLQVDPSSPAGRGKAHYRLGHEGKEVWSAELPFTLWESFVGDDGSVAGYAYGNGIEGWSGVRGDHSDGDFRVVILDPAGAPRLDVSTQRSGSRFLHVPPQPIAAGLLFDPDSDRFVVRVAAEDLNRGSEEWWPFRLSTGEALPRFRPRERLEDPESARWIISARHVKQTPLFILHWWTFDDRSNSDRWAVGGRFTLIDLDGSLAWTLDVPTDYTLPGDAAGEDRLQDEIRASGAILDCAAPGQFEVRLIAEGKRVSFEATPDATAARHWTVVEVGRTDWSGEPQHAESVAVTEGRLEQVGTLALGESAVPEPQFGLIDRFDIDDRGRFGFTRRDGDNALSFLLVSPEGSVLSEVPIDLGAAGAAQSVAVEWLAKDRWFLYLTWPGAGNENPAWWLDVETRHVEPVANLQLSAIRSIDGDGQGGFVAVESTQLRHSTEETIGAFDATGRPRWTMVSETQGETKPHSPEAVAVAADGRVGVLDNIQNVVLLYAPDGSYAATIDLEKSWGWAPNYPSGLASDASGGWIVHDFDGRVPLVRMSAAGEVVARLNPAFPDGRKLDPIGRVVASLDGGLWTTDGHALLHVNGEATVDRVAGSAPDSGRLDSVAVVAIDPRGRILLSDERTGAVHVFDGEGSRLFVCRPAPQDDTRFQQIAGAADGRIFAGGAKGFVCYSSQGERTGTTDKILNPTDKRWPLSEQWLFQPQGGKRWVVAHSVIALADADGKVARRIEKRPDGTWLTSLGAASVAPDGSLAVISGSVCIYAPDGESRQAIVLPQGTGHARIAFDGTRVLLATEEALFVLDTRSGGWKRYPFASKTNGFSAVFLAPDGERIRLVPYRSSQVLEFRLSD